MRSILFAALLFLSVGTHGQNQPFKITKTHLVGNIYVHTSFGLAGGKTPFPSNGLYIVTNGGIILIDTPWGEDQTQQLIDLLEKTYKKKIVLCISTHFHDDRTSGLDLLKKQGVKTYSSALTKQLCIQKGQKQAEFTFKNDTSFTVGNVTLQTFYPGEGHTKDNIVIWLPKDKVLFGGCLVKSLETDSPGNVEDANLKEWPSSVMRVMLNYKDIRFLIPGHQGWRMDNFILPHTIAVLTKKQTN